MLIQICDCQLEIANQSLSFSMINQQNLGNAI